MASLNKVQLIGRLGKDPEMRYLDSGTAVTNFSMATDFKAKDKEPVTEWHRVVLWGKLAEIAAEYLRKGSQVYIEGRLQTRKWTDSNDIERYNTDIVAASMILLSGKDDKGSKNTGSDRNNENRSGSDEDIPF